MYLLYVTWNSFTGADMAGEMWQERACEHLSLWLPWQVVWLYNYLFASNSQGRVSWPKSQDSISHLSHSEIMLMEMFIWPASSWEVGCQILFFSVLKPLPPSCWWSTLPLYLLSHNLKIRLFRKPSYFITVVCNLLSTGGIFQPPRATLCF